ncbi:beta-1,6-N-acetylglucosaminyltransferase [Kineococcus indalonis]|uniref:beta-1,6-N-acetylglucosaminyltransferase n=1 Tax=Kineococcus indalonis TaxID=2696566 RepID=UPI001412AC69|nr:beta-1,6-N-acetylglucosaminyltransferase [Kineococcus indalonis]NAZ87339.1 glycosyl transferase family 14 [Kineococcus indalonis]
MSLTAVVLAHRDAEQVRRLLGALEDVPVVLHCDAKAPADVAGRMLQGWGERVRAQPRTSAALDSWSLVRVELDALRSALRFSSAEHVAVLSGADYPLLGVQELLAELGAWRGRSRIVSAPLPHRPWDTPRNPDGGRWRTEHRFLTRGDDVLFVGRVPLRWPWRRALPPGLQVRASSQWKVFAREDVQRLLGVVDARPDLVRFWRTTLVPDESFAASVLSSPALTGAPPLPDCHASAWFQRWPGDGSHHPAELTAQDFPALAAARSGAPGSPVQDPPRPWFARKLSSAVSGELADRIDAELRTGRRAGEVQPASGPR